MNEQNYESNIENVETNVDFEPMIVEEVDSGRNDMVIGVGVGAAAAILIEHVVIPAGKKIFKKVKGLKDRKKIHVIENPDNLDVDENDIED